ncbi:MAG: hypothetical protein AAGU27_24800 [Dehalobacterium sp.]
MEDCSCSDYITVIMKSYHWDEGEHEDVTCIRRSRYTMLYPDQDMQLNM